jgi:hypothetical protein
MNELASQPKKPNIVTTRVGVIFGDLGKLNVPALKDLIVHLNTLQRSFEFELLAVDMSDPLIALLRPGEAADRESCRVMLAGFQNRMIERVNLEQKTVRFGRQFHSSWICRHYDGSIFR